MTLGKSMAHRIPTLLFVACSSGRSSQFCQPWPTVRGLGLLTFPELAGLKIRVLTLSLLAKYFQQEVCSSSKCAAKLISHCLFPGPYSRREKTHKHLGLRSSGFWLWMWPCEWGQGWSSYLLISSALLTGLPRDMRQHVPYRSTLPRVREL